MPKWETKATSCPIDKLERRISGRGPVRARKGFSLLISIEDVDDYYNRRFTRKWCLLRMVLLKH